MAKKIFINLPVTDLPGAMAFYAAVGFVNNPAFTDETAACMVWSEEIYVMLLTREKFAFFTAKKIADTRETAAVINSLAMDSLEEMNRFAENALAAGAVETKEPVDMGFMQQRSLSDPDGHLWEVVYMDMSQLPHN
ncbi:glyoxalase/bleomycin resistance/extradiol dioxygenase family protein [Flavihumibacter sp. CACIAM 22H1]|uniref:VOC family protein n=1 Tax=Flavihumibacter sp. CACIAM 22H1 TaxID=1812911 RepID=UPI0007A81EB6|nr:glyoxalase/bleomycin resistance/extradiol dioxygenase family protein [Flavihumibacter sp. CACIAM 22H1]KYP14130.1 MAG: extradiol dioxygenase [Flavihumibacter sp. CACIAM 22H1]